MSGYWGLPPLIGVTLLTPSLNITVHSGPKTYTSGTSHDPFIGTVSCQRFAMQVSEDLRDKDSRDHNFCYLPLIRQPHNPAQQDLSVYFPPLVGGSAVGPLLYWGVVTSSSVRPEAAASDHRTVDNQLHQAGRHPPVENQKHLPG